jgi:NADH:ubiquinone oxidoreductase subunit 2 (subunit N)
VPPLLGFIGRWRLYETALQIGWPMAATFILSSILALIAYVLALTRFWWGPSRGKGPPDPKATREPFLLQATIVGLTMMLVLAGIWPGLLQMVQGGR